MFSLVTVCVLLHRQKGNTQKNVSLYICGGWCVLRFRRFFAKNINQHESEDAALLRPLDCTRFSSPGGFLDCPKCVQSGENPQNTSQYDITMTKRNLDLSQPSLSHTHTHTIKQSETVCEKSWCKIGKVDVYTCIRVRDKHLLRLFMLCVLVRGFVRIPPPKKQGLTPPFFLSLFSFSPPLLLCVWFLGDVSRRVLN